MPASEGSSSYGPKRMTFAELVEGWVFCGSRLLRVRYERARAAASSDADQTVLGKILDMYVDRLNAHRGTLVAEGKDTTNVDTVLQRATSKDYYMSELLGGRFQVAESVTPVGTYYIVDHKMTDLLFRPGGAAADFPRFDSKEAAHTKVDYLLDIVGKQTTLLSRGKARMASIKKDTDAAERRKEREEKGTPSSLFKKLIMEGKMTDDAIFATVQKEFGLDDNKRSYVNWYRKDLIKKGETPPARKDGTADKKASPTKADKKASEEKTGKDEVIKAAAKARKASMSPPALTAKTDKLVSQAKQEARGRKPGRSKAA